MRSPARILVNGMLVLLLYLVMAVDAHVVVAYPELQSPPKEMIINLWNRTLTLKVNGTTTHVYPIGAGTRDTPSPVGMYTVINKSRGWDGGFGSRWMQLSVPWGLYGIHGTNKPHSIGGYVSHGCIRMLNKHVEELYDLVDNGTRVTIDGPLTGHKDLTYRVLVLGSRGALVQMVQNRLQAAGYYDGECHGIFDQRTEKALLAYQQEHQLELSGQIHYVDMMHLGLDE